MKKLMYITSAILAIFIALILTGKKSVHDEITVNASPEKVWEVLTDIGEYPKWNPVMKVLEGELKEGNTVKYLFIQDSELTSEIDATVVQMSPNRLLNQKGGIPLLLTYDHNYFIEPMENSTKVIIHEDYRGAGVNFWNPKPVGEAYGRLNRALKERAEKF